MLKKTFIALTLSLVSLLAISVATSLRSVSAQPVSQTARSPQRANSAVATTPETGTLQKMIVENGGVTMDLDLNGFNGSSSLVARPVTLQFAVAADSFFPILIFNDQLRGPVPGSMALIPQNTSSAGFDAPGYSNLPAALGASLKQLVVEKLPTGEAFDLAVRDSNTGFTFFNVEGHKYDYDANAQA